MSTLPSQISDLSISEKLDLLDALWQDIEGQASTLSLWQTEELDRRTAAYEQSPSAVTPWEQVKADLLKR